MRRLSVEPVRKRAPDRHRDARAAWADRRTRRSNDVPQWFGRFQCVAALLARLRMEILSAQMRCRKNRPRPTGPALRPVLPSHPIPSRQGPGWHVDQQPQHLLNVSQRRICARESKAKSAEAQVRAMELYGDCKPERLQSIPESYGCFN